MNENLDLKQDNNSRMVRWVTCPDCGKKRWMRLSNYERSGRTGLCFQCHNIRQSNGTNGHTHEGYVFVKADGHPRSTREGFVKRAVLVLEQKLGRHLLRTEHVHHLNGIRNDDRPENLVTLSNSEHARLHMTVKPNIKNRYKMALAQQ